MITAIAHTSYFQAKRASATPMPAAKTGLINGVLARDTYVPSGEADRDRSALLKAVKGRIKSGFYNSETVVDDLSNVIAKAMNKIL